MQGSLTTIAVAQWVTIIACMIMGMLFFFLTLDPARAMSFAAAYTAPSFAFMGITFPTTDMGSLAQIWRSILPISHYIDVQVSQVSYGLNAFDSLQQLWPMFGFIVPLALCFVVIKKHQRKEQQIKEKQVRGSHELV